MAYNILIVDDEPAITNGLAYDIDWSQIGVLEVFKANSMPVALEYLQNNKVDVVITDIRMPGMDGLELAAHIQKKWHFAKTIFISGYDEFEYAQKAIDLGVFSYITKPIPNPRLREVVARALAAMEAEMDRSRLLSRAAQERDDMLAALREREWNLWIAKGRAAPAAASRERAQIELGDELFLLLVAPDERADGISGTNTAEQMLARIADSILFAGRGREQHFVDAQDNYVIVASLADRAALQDMYRFMKGMAEAFQAAALRSAKCSVSLFFGAIVPLDQAHGEYMRLLCDANAREPREPGVIMLPESAALLRDTCAAEAPASRASRLVEQVCRYARENIQREITVADIAAHLHLHPNYLLRLFKEQTGEAVIELLIRTRIERAMELLRTDPQVKIYEVAEAVGYDSVSHFSRIFKRKTGMSPKDYQQQRHGI